MCSSQTQGTSLFPASVLFPLIGVAQVPCTDPAGGPERKGVDSHLGWLSALLLGSRGALGLCPRC